MCFFFASSMYLRFLYVKEIKQQLRDEKTTKKRFVTFAGHSSKNKTCSNNNEVYCPCQRQFVVTII